MTYGIGWVFDPHTEAHIREVWGRLVHRAPGAGPQHSVGVDIAPRDRMYERKS